MALKVSFFGRISASNEARDRNDNTSTDQTRLQASLIGRSIARFGLTCQPDYVSNRDRYFGASSQGKASVI
jgi:hypothetical protein